MAVLVAVYADDLAEHQEASCNFDKANKKDVTLRRRGDDENGNDSNPTKIMLEAGTSLQHDLRWVAIVAVLVITSSSDEARIGKS